MFWASGEAGDALADGRKSVAGRAAPLVYDASTESVGSESGDQETARILRSEYRHGLAARRW